VAAWSFFPSEAEVILLPHAKFVVANMGRCDCHMLTDELE